MTVQDDTELAWKHPLQLKSGMSPQEVMKIPEKLAVAPFYR